MVLTIPVDIKRHQQFEKDVDDLMKYGYMRRYTSEISKATGEDRSNITKYYKGTLPIGDNFLKKFKDAYAPELKRIRKKTKGADRPLASNTGIRQSQTDPTNMPPNTSSSKPTISESTEDTANSMEQRLANIEAAIARQAASIATMAAAIVRLEQKIDAQSGKPKKKK